MTCLEAQSKIMAFIDNKLSDEELYDFVRHVKSCPNCAEELEIYYTMLIGMKQLDNHENLSSDFKGELNQKLNSSLHRINNTKKLKTSTAFLVVALILTAGIVSYNNFLTMVYHKEQEIKLSRQTENYYYDTFASSVIKENRIQIRELSVQVEQMPESVTTLFYRKVHEYNLAHLEIEGEVEHE